MELAKNFVEGAKGIGNEVSLSKRFLINTDCGFIIAVFQISAPFKGGCDYVGVRHVRE